MSGPEWSEADELQKMLGMLDTDEATFQLGLIMGIMHKTDAVHITRLEGEIESLKATIAAMSDAMGSHEQDSEG